MGGGRNFRNIMFSFFIKFSQAITCLSIINYIPDRGIYIPFDPLGRWYYYPLVQGRRYWRSQHYVTGHYAALQGDIPTDAASMFHVKLRVHELMKHIVLILFLALKCSLKHRGKTITHLKLSAPLLSINTVYQVHYILTLIPQAPKEVTDLV